MSHICIWLITAIAFGGYAFGWWLRGVIDIAMQDEAKRRGLPR